MSAGLREGADEVCAKYARSLDKKKLDGLRRDFLQKQRSWLDGYASEIYKGTHNANPNRSAMYAQALHSFEEEVRAQVAEERGAAWERRVLGSTDHGCPECRELAEEGWKPLGSLPAIGATTCLTNCRCRFEYSHEKPSKKSTNK